MQPNDLSTSANSCAATSPPQSISINVLLEKYAKNGEQSIKDVRRRVARALAQAEAPEQRAFWEERFYLAQAGGFIPGGACG